MIKAAGAFLICLGAAGLGWQMAFLWKERLELLIALRRLIYYLKGEILYGHGTLAEALLQSGRKAGGPFGEMFERAAERLEFRDGTPFSQIWRSEADKLARLPLLSDDWERLKALGDSLGYLDLTMQERTLLLYLEQLAESIGYLKEHKREKCRLYMSLGIMGGLFLTITFL